MENVFLKKSFLVKRCSIKAFTDTCIKYIQNLKKRKENSLMDFSFIFSIFFLVLTSTRRKKLYL